MANSQSNKAPRPQGDRGAQPWFEKRRKKQRRLKKMQKASRRANR